jgi:signal transduction histidine kinase
VFPGNPDFSLPLRGSLALLALLIIILFMSYATVSWLIKPLLKAKERLLVDVSHELRSPLARAKLALAMIPKSANQKSISRAVSEMESMLHEILESERLKSRHGSLSLNSLNLVKLAGQLASSYKDQAPGLKIIPPKSFPLLKLDEEKIVTVLKNVVENSLKYSQDQALPVELSFMEDEKSAYVKVRDFGIGIPKEDLRLVFEPFYRVDKSRAKKTGGYGLGLSLCRQIMQAHGGKISLESRHGSGTEVVLSFPKKSAL